MTPFADLLPLVLPHLRGCDALVAESNLRLAAIELCRRALVWQTAQPSIAAVASQTAYAYTPAAGQQIVKLLRLTVEGIPARIVDPGEGRAMAEHDAGGNFAYGTLSGFALYPARAAGALIVTTCAVAPALGADSLDDALANRYAEQLARGALHRLMGMPGLSYTNLKLAQELREEWEQRDIPAAQHDAFKGNARSVSRTRTTWF